MAEKQLKLSDQFCCCSSTGISRRDALKAIGGLVGSISLPVMAGPFERDSLNRLTEDSNGPIPLDKKLSDAWIKSLTTRGAPTTYTGWQQLKYIGMPISGIGTGTVYIGGDGKLWVWDIFNENHEGVVPQIYTHPTLVNEHGNSEIKERNGANYINPPAQISPWHFDQGFALRIKNNDGDKHRLTLDHNGFQDISFTGQQPIAEVEYNHPDSQIEVKLEAMTPFIPLDTDRSSYPATIMSYAVTNNSSESQEVILEGWFKNPVFNGNVPIDTRLVTETYQGSYGKGIYASAKGVTPEVDNSIQDHPAFGSFAIHCLDNTCKAMINSHHAMLENSMQLDAGETRTVNFIVSWYFPNQKSLFKKQHKNLKRWYATQFENARAVAEEIARSFTELTGLTRLWRDNWYDSTLPHWLLERTMIPTNALQTNTSYRLENGRFWAWEGVGCCAGTCTHVWHYAQAVGRLFPDLERDLRERTDYGIALKDNGAIVFRGEYGKKDATDGQAGVILRTYREHQMTSDDAFLNKLWPKAKKAMQYLIATDARQGTPDGIPEGEQHNTLDAEWYGKIPVLSSLYLAALKACVEMAKVVGDDEFADYCNKIFQHGKENILTLFNKDFGFFTQEIDPAHVDAIGIGDGCYIDQVMGQWWANQLGLGRLYDGKKIRSALSSLWDYNFCPDMGVLRDSIKTPSAKGRTYALAGEAGLVMCTWPKGGRRDDWEKYWQYGYFNECMTGFEYQVAGHMIWESDEEPELLTKGLAISRSIHDRYHASKRNPFNEIECSDHYARAMASYGVFLAACGFEYDGPRKHIGFKPRLTHRGKFKSAFTCANGWGSFELNNSHALLSMIFGSLRLSSVSIRVNKNINLSSTVKTNWGNASVRRSGLDLTLSFDNVINLSANDHLKINLIGN